MAQAIFDINKFVFPKLILADVYSEQYIFIREISDRIELFYLSWYFIYKARELVYELNG